MGDVSTGPHVIGLYIDVSEGRRPDLARFCLVLRTESGRVLMRGLDDDDAGVTSFFNHITADELAAMVRAITRRDVA